MNSEDKIIDQVVSALKGVEGIEALVLGGSRARGTHHKDSDIDLGIYYLPGAPPDLSLLSRIISGLDDEHRSDLMTQFFEWGPWINGGGWTVISSVPVDFLYRSLSQTLAVLDDCLSGRVTIDYQPGHPHGFVNSVYLAEVSVARVLWDPFHKVEQIKEKIAVYPASLKTATIQKFMWESKFSLRCAEKGFKYQDISYVAGCCFRSVSCLIQVLFALNEKYWMNEKGSVRLASSFPISPDHLEKRVGEIFSLLKPQSISLNSVVEEVSQLVQDVEGLLKS